MNGYHKRAKKVIFTSKKKSNFIFGNIDRNIYGSVPQINPFWSLCWAAVHHNWCIFTEWQWGFLVKSWFGGFQPERAIATLSTPPRSCRLFRAWGSNLKLWKEAQWIRALVIKYSHQLLQSIMKSIMKKGSDDTTTAAPLMQYSLLVRRVSPSSWDRARQAETSRNCEKKSLLILPCFCQSLIGQYLKEVITVDLAFFCHSLISQSWYSRNTKNVNLLGNCCW